MDDLQTAIEVLKLKIRAREEDVARLKRTVNELCADAGQPPQYAVTTPDAAGEVAILRSDTFYGQTISGAAKVYLEMRKSAGRGAASVNEIYQALRDGGYKFEAKDDENAKNGLRISLRKNSSVFHRLPNGDYGLLVWYPNAKPPKDKEPDETEPPVTAKKQADPPRRRTPGGDTNLQKKPGGGITVALLSWFADNGRGTATQIAEDTGISPQEVESALKGDRELFQCHGRTWEQI